jgi:hypothetical protein
VWPDTAATEQGAPTLHPQLSALSESFLISRENIKMVINHSIVSKFEVFIAGLMNIPNFWIMMICKSRDL